jgi:ubiquinone biosynthesis protein COQ4
MPSPTEPRAVQARLRPRSPPLRPRRAAAAFRRLLADREDTLEAFEIVRALGGRATERGYRRLIATQRGGRIAYRRPELSDRLRDPARVAAFAEGTVGAAYRGFMQSERLSRAGFEKASYRPRSFMIDLEHPVAWFGRRIRDTHDLWHVLTGYGREPLGELCLAAFSWRQTGELGFGFIALAGAVEILRRGEGLKPLRAILEGWRAAGRARWLLAEDYDRLVQEPLATARERLGLSAPALYDSFGAEGRRAVLKPVRP